MKAKNLSPVMRGISAAMASVLALAVTGTSVADTYRTNVDDVLGTQSYVTSSDKDSARFKSDYATVEDMMAAAKDIAIREGEEGTVVMKNDNDVLPLNTTNVALFGLAAYAPYPYAAGDLKAGNDDAVDLVQALTDAGLTVNETVKSFYETMMNRHEEEVANQWTGEMQLSIGFDNIYSTTVGDMVEYTINEVPASKYEELGAPADWKSQIDKDNTTVICVFARAAGESNTYAPG